MLFGRKTDYFSHNSTHDRYAHNFISASSRKHNKFNKNSNIIIMERSSSISLNNQGFYLINQKRYDDAAEILRDAILLMRSEAKIHDGILNVDGTNDQPLECNDEHDEIVIESKETFENTNVKFEDSSSSSVDDYVYSTPIFLFNASANEFRDRFFAITFNLALANHLQSLNQDQATGDDDDDCQSSDHLKMVAKQLYELALQIEGCDGNYGFHITAAIFNNLSNISRSLSNGEEMDAEKYDELLLQCLCYFVETSNAFTATKAYRGFMANASRRILKENAAAAA